MKDYRIVNGCVVSSSNSGDEINTYTHKPSHRSATFISQPNIKFNLATTPNNKKSIFNIVLTITPRLIRGAQISTSESGVSKSNVLFETRHDGLATPKQEVYNFIVGAETGIDILVLPIDDTTPPNVDVMLDFIEINLGG